MTTPDLDAVVPPHLTVRTCDWNGQSWTLSATVHTKLRFGAPLYDQAALDAAIDAARTQGEKS